MKLLSLAIEYLEGSQPDPKNVAVLEMKPPTKVKEVRRFLRMTGFYNETYP